MVEFNGADSDSRIPGHCRCDVEDEGTNDGARDDGSDHNGGGGQRNDDGHRGGN